MLSLELHLGEAELFLPVGRFFPALISFPRRGYWFHQHFAVILILLKIHFLLAVKGIECEISENSQAVQG